MVLVTERAAQQP
jgi:ribonuclease HI